MTVKMKLGDNLGHQNISNSIYNKFKINFIKNFGPIPLKLIF